MKKQSYCLMLGIMALVVASCSQSDEPISENDGGLTSLTVTVTADEVLKSRAGENDADPMPTDCYLEYWQIDENGDRIAGTSRSMTAQRTDDNDDNDKYIFKIKELEKAKTYRFGFWASNATQDDYVWNNDNTQGTDWLSKIILKPGYIAFFASEDYQPIDGAKKEITLKHVVAKIELEHTGTEPMKEGDVLTLASSNPTWTFNALEGEYLDPDTENTLDWSKEFTISSTNMTGTLGATYLMTADSQELVNVTISLTRNNVNFGSSQLDISNVPVRANYRTVICGDFNKLYNGVSQDFTFQLDKEWEDDNNQSIPK